MALAFIRDRACHTLSTAAALCLEERKTMLPLMFPSGPRTRQLLLIAVACASIACGVVSSYENEGELCYRSTASGQLEVRVRFPTCLSSCSREVETSCTIAVDGSRITISSQGSVERQGGSCTDECGPLVAECVGEPLPAGPYELRHGGSSREIVLPTVQPADGFVPGNCL
ncbi:MAG: hypothetical protein RL685_2636 [Pseudomonadota bacterium]|jgi:hypothetical protein